MLEADWEWLEKIKAPQEQGSIRPGEASAQTCSNHLRNARYFSTTLLQQENALSEVTWDILFQWLSAGQIVQNGNDRGLLGTPQCQPQENRGLTLLLCQKSFSLPDNNLLSQSSALVGS
jgi:hypothetical protein